MDFDLRDSLLILGPIFIAAILLHGYWRMRSNNNKLKMSLDKSYMSAPGERLGADEDIDMLRAELPNGGARVRTIPEQTALDLNEDVPVLMEPVLDDEDGVSAAEDAPLSVQSSEAAERPEFFAVVYVTSVGEPFEGQRLLECLVENDMQFGEMDIFHRHGSGEFTEFSLVNAVEPGTFDMNTINEMSTPAVSLFTRVHEQDDPVAVYDRMIDVAEALANELGGEVKDESRDCAPSSAASARCETRL